jgi:hypothetical protein
MLQRSAAWCAAVATCSKLLQRSVAWCAAVAGPVVPVPARRRAPQAARDRRAVLSPADVARSVLELLLMDTAARGIRRTGVRLSSEFFTAALRLSRVLHRGASRRRDGPRVAQVIPHSTVSHGTVSHAARYPAQHGIPRGTVSRAARYPAQHGIPRGTVSRAAQHPAQHGIPRGTVTHRGTASRTAWYPARHSIPRSTVTHRGAESHAARYPTTARYGIPHDTVSRAASTVQTPRPHSAGSVLP